VPSVNDFVRRPDAKGVTNTIALSMINMVTKPNTHPETPSRAGPQSGRLQSLPAKPRRLAVKRRLIFKTGWVAAKGI